MYGFFYKKNDSNDTRNKSWDLDFFVLVVLFYYYKMDSFI